MKRLLSALGVVALVAGCVGSPIHSTMKYNEVQATIRENNEHLLRMRVGMSREEAHAVMGQPERSEGYAWGSAWLYRTAMTSGVYGTDDADFTPVVIDPEGHVVGWGRNFFAEFTKKYDLNITSN